MKIKFGLRKIQNTQYSFLIPLPPEWVKSVDLCKGDVVNIEMNDDESLRITPVPKVTRKDAEGNRSTDQTHFKKERRCVGNV